MSGEKDNKIRSFFKVLVRVILVYIPGWLFLYPLALIVPKNRELVLFIGRDRGRFLDNVKYLFSHAYRQGPGAKILFLTEEMRTFNLLKKNRIPVTFHPSLKSFISLLRARVIVVDNRLWIRKYKVYLAARAKKVQLWHGVGFKKIETDNPSFNRTIINRLINILRWRLPKYTLLVSTSEFYTKNVFASTIKTEEIKEFGYPRNDVFFRDPDELDLLETDIDLINRVKKLKEEGYKLIIYAPTFRDFTDNEPIEGGFLDVDRLKEFAISRRFVFVMKFHPEVKVPEKFRENFPVFFYHKGKDIYPLLPVSDLLVTDYSSIYMDYLLTGKPVVFFPYDYETYVTVDREIQFDYEWITPGPKCYNQKELEAEIERILINGKDNYMQRREEILNIAFKYRDGRASERIWSYIKERLLY